MVDLGIDIYEICEVCGGRMIVSRRLPSGLIICSHCNDNTYQCEECCEYFDGTNPTATSADSPHRDFCPFCGSHKIFKAVEE